MKPFEDYYEILQVHPLAEPEIIEVAYKRLSRKYHPDVDHSPDATEKMKRINIAYEVLSNSEKRKVYHAQWIKGKGHTANTTGTASRSSAGPMNYSFLVEVRLRDNAENYYRSLIKEIGQRFSIRGGTNAEGFKGHPRNRALPPHITLYGTAKTNDVNKVINTIETIGSKYTLVPFSIRGEFINLHDRVICIMVNPSQQLDELRWELSKELNKFCVTKPYDLERAFVFHIALSNEQNTEKLNRIVKYLKTKQARTFDLYLTRLTLLEDGSDKIVCEYDLVLKKLLSREQSLDRHWANATIERLNQLL